MPQCANAQGERGELLSAEGWSTLFAPKSMPAAQVQRYADSESDARPGYGSIVQGSNLDPVVSSQEQTRVRLAAYKKQWEPVIRESGYKP